MIKRIVMMEGGVETLSYFSHQMAQEFQMLGYAVFFYDLKQEESSAGKLQQVYQTARDGACYLQFPGTGKGGRRVPRGDRLSLGYLSYSLL